MFTSFYTVDGGTRFEGVTSSSHNEALRRTRRLFSRQGFRVVRDETWMRTGQLAHVTLRNPAGTTVVVEVDRA